MDVLIAGAGPTGLALACGLRMHGVDVRVVDAAAGPAQTSRANILHARGVEVLDRLQALGDLRERAVQAMHFTTYVRGRVVSKVRFGDPGLGTTAGSLNVSQAEVERALRERFEALGGALDWGSALVSAAQDPDGVVVTLADGSAVRAGFLVGCDGAHSTARRLAGIGFPGEPVADRWLIADVRATWPGADHTGTSLWLHPDGSAFAVPMQPPSSDGSYARAGANESGEPADGAAGAYDRENFWRMMIYQRGERSKELEADAVLERFRSLMPARSGVPGLRIHSAVWTSDFQIHRRIASSYRTERILLAGDAAHIHSPLGGQGMLTGLGDAENLAWKLALVVQGLARPELLDTYEAERRPLAETVMRGTGKATRLETRDGALSRWILEHVVARLVRLPAVQRWSTWQASQLWTTYRDGPLGAPSGRRPRPGDRMPDLPCRRPDGTETRLHAELGGHWALVGPAALADPAALLETARGSLGGRVVRLERTTDDGTAGNSTAGDSTAGDGALLVRPDGHLAWRESRRSDHPRGSGGGDDLETWLRGALGR